MEKRERRFSGEEYKERNGDGREICKKLKKVLNLKHRWAGNMKETEKMIRILNMDEQSNCKKIKTGLRNFDEYR